MDSPRPRNRKIEAELQRALADIIARELKDPRVGNVTISAVDLSPDKRLARVFFTPFASPHPVEEVRAGTECGIGVKNYQDVRVGDQIECFARVEVARTLQ